MNNLEASPDNASTVKRDLLASVVVFLVALPLCMGIAIVSGAPVATGLITEEQKLSRRGIVSRVTSFFRHFHKRIDKLVQLAKSGFETTSDDYRIHCNGFVY